MKKIRKIVACLFIVGLLFSMIPYTSAEEQPIRIQRGDFSMVPGEYTVLRVNTLEGIDIVETTWSADKYNVVTVDTKTGRVDAIGSGKATITATSVDKEDNTYKATSEITVSSGATPIVEPISALQNNNRPDFMMGADVSSLYEIMKQNKKYYNLDGEESHLFDILAENGVNWVRLRVWNDPYDQFGNPYGGGNSNIDSTIELAKQAKERGMKIFVTFHYSDFWAHPGQQIRPKEWSNLTGQALADAVGKFTADSLTKMKNAGVYPNMVGIGNETNSNIVDVNFQLTAEGYMNPTAVEVFKAGSAAVRSTDPNVNDPEKKTLVSFHLANGNNTWLYNSFALAMQKNNVDYDAIGASYYPSWHGAYEEVLNNLNTITKTYGKFAFIAETAYPWTIKENAGDDTPQNFKHGDVSTVGLAASVQGQATALREVLNVAANIQSEKGLGAFYWEPAWLPGSTTGWATPYGTGWEVAGLFDINGYALPSIKTFNLVRSNQPLPANANDYAYGWETQVVINKGSVLSMPDSVIAVKNNGMMGNTSRTITKQPVTWNALDVSKVDVNTPGEYIVFGSVGGTENNTFAHVIVKETSSSTAASPTFSLRDHSSVAAKEDGYSSSTRHVVKDGGLIEMQTETPNAGIYFTLDGANPIDGNGSTKELVGAPWIKAWDSVRVYSGSIQITKNVKIQAVARRQGYNYVPGKWGSDITILNNSPIVSVSYKAVYDYKNHLLKNGGFETKNLSGWTLTSQAATADVITPEDYVTYSFAGDNSFKFTLNAGEKLTLSQKVDVPNGVYRLSMYGRGDNQTTDETNMKLSATSRGHEFSSHVKMTNVPGGSMVWKKYSIDDIEVRDGKLTISFDAQSQSAGSFTGYLDHFVLSKKDEKLVLANTEGLEEAISKAESIDSKLFTAESAAIFQAALNHAINLLQDEAAPQNEIDNAETNLLEAIDGLKITYNGLISLTKQFIEGNKGISHSLVSSLEAAKASEKRGNIVSKNEQLKAYENKVNAQNGKALTHEQAEELLKWVRNLK